MPPRHAYWTIILDDQPTSFRAHDVEELLPTFNRLREKHPNTQLKWFERGQLFDTRDAAREQGYGKGERRWEGPRPGAPHDEREGRSAPTGERRARDDRSGGASGPPGERGPHRDEPPRDKRWRPGGDHRDPRQKYKDAKKAKWQRFKQNLRTRWDEKQERTRDGEAPAARPRRDEGEFTPPHGDPIRPKLERPAAGERKPGERRNLGAPAAMREDQSRGGGSRDRWRDDRSGGEWRPDNRRPPRRDDRRGQWDRRGGDAFSRDRDDRPFNRGDDRDDRRSNRGGGSSFPPRDREGPRSFDRRGGASAPPRREGWKPKGPAKRHGSPRAGDRESRGDKKPWGKKPGGARKPWGAKPGGARKPWGAKPGGASKAGGKSRPQSKSGFRKKPFGPPGSGSRGGPRKKRRDDDE